VHSDLGHMGVQVPRDTTRGQDPAAAAGIPSGRPPVSKRTAALDPHGAAVAVAIVTSDLGVLVGRRADVSPLWTFPAGNPRGSRLRGHHGSAR
jgi:hypothetical protein